MCVEIGLKVKLELLINVYFVFFRAALKLSIS